MPEKNNLGIKISYKEQQRPNGLPEAFLIGEKFIGKENVALILGDNLFHGDNFSQQLKNADNKDKGGTKSIISKNENSKIGTFITTSKNRADIIKNKIGYLM